MLCFLCLFVLLYDIGIKFDIDIDILIWCQSHCENKTVSNIVWVCVFGVWDLCFPDTHTQTVL